MPHVIVVGNEKGGTGKSTTAMHLIAALAHLEFKVGALDLDVRQRSLTRYIDNRTNWCAREGRALPMPHLVRVDISAADMVSEAQRMDRENLEQAFEGMLEQDFVVIDSPGSDTYLSRLAHAHADTIVTPMNDSFVDFDLLARLDPDTGEVVGPSLYSEIVWEARKRQANAGHRQGIDWVVMRNRLGALDAINKRKVGEKLEELAKRIGFRLAPGFGERVIYREMFPKGLTLLDLSGAGVRMTMSHVAARQEMRGLLETLNLPQLEEFDIAV